MSEKIKVIGPTPEHQICLKIGVHQICSICDMANMSTKNGQKNTIYVDIIYAAYMVLKKKHHICVKINICSIYGVFLPNKLLAIT